MSIQEDISCIKQLHDKYAAIRYDDSRSLETIELFRNWHAKAAILFARYIPNNDPDYIRFKDVKTGNRYVLASVFDNIETTYCILVEKIRSSVYYRLEQLIEEGEDIVSSIAYVEAPRGIIRTYSVYQIGKNKEFLTWKNKCLRVLEFNFKDGSITCFKDALDKFEKNCNAPKYMYDMIGVLKACVDIPSASDKVPVPIEQPANPSPVTINVNQTQTQSQNQSTVTEIFLESIKDEISGKQVKELKAIVKEEPNPVKARTKILEKINSFGSDVLSNIVANIVTNPTVWAELI